MEIRYKKASREDIEMLTRTRVLVLRAANLLDEAADLSEVERESRDYYDSALADESHVAYLALEGGKCVGTGGVSFYRVMPTVHNSTGNKAYIMNMYTDPKYRRKGIAYHMLDLLIAASKEKGIGHITLEATAAGRPLYKKYGFVEMKDEMQLPE